MSDAWKPVLEELRETMIPEFKARVAAIDMSGDMVSDILEIADAVPDLIDIADKYLDEIEGLSDEDERELFIHGMDEAIKLPFWAESFDDNVLGVVYDFVQAKRKKAA